MRVLSFGRSAAKSEASKGVIGERRKEPIEQHDCRTRKVPEENRSGAWARRLFFVKSCEDFRVVLSLVLDILVLITALSINYPTFGIIIFTIESVRILHGAELVANLFLFGVATPNIKYTTPTDAVWDLSIPRRSKIVFPFTAK